MEYPMILTQNIPDYPGLVVRAYRNGHLFGPLCGSVPKAQ